MVRPKPRTAWDRADLNFALEQRELHPAERRQLLEPWLIGSWDALQLDPRVWGISSSLTSSRAPCASYAGLAGCQERDRDHTDTGAMGAPLGEPTLPPNADNDKVKLAYSHKLSLLGMDVKAVSSSFSMANSHKRQILGVADHGVAWPSLWPLDDPATHPLSANMQDEQLRRLGLAGLEERWRRMPNPSSLDDFADYPVNRPPSWLSNSHLDLHLAPSCPTARGARAALRALRDTPAPQTAPLALHPTPTPPQAKRVPPDRADCKDVWSRLLDPTIHRPHAITCWRILHGKLGVHAFMRHAHKHTPAASGLCRAPQCSQAGSLETLSHAFLDCPESAPAVDWLCRAWASLTGGPPPPLSAAVLLGDDLRGWLEGNPSSHPSLLALWTRLRVSLLGSLWKARCARDQGSLRFVSLAREAVTSAVETVADAIQRDWLRTTIDLRTLDNGSFCTEWWRGLNPALSVVDFTARWTHGSFFCSVEWGDADADPPVPPSLSCRLGPELPLPFPP